MTTITLNDQMLTIENNLSLQELLLLQKYNQNHIAVAVNRHLIPPCDYAKTSINDQDVIEIVAPMQGG